MDKPHHVIVCVDHPVFLQLRTLTVKVLFPVERPSASSRECVVGGMRGLVYMDFAQLWIAHGCGMWQDRISQE